MTKKVWEPRHGARWTGDPWDDPDVTDAVVLERPRRQWSGVRWLAYAVGLAALVALLVVGAVGFWYVREVNPAGEPTAPITFTVEPGDDLAAITERLHERGFISNPGLFEWYVERNDGLEIVPGYYELRKNDHMGNVLRTLRTPPGQTFTRVTFPEGFTIGRMSERLNDRVPRVPADEFVTAATDGSVRSSLQPPDVTSMEGLLFPDTYEVSNDETARQVVQRMSELMERVGRQLEIEERAPRIGITPYQALIVASMIEREAKVDDDRAKIARVIYNRLFLAMPLQIDATLYYGQDPDTPFDELRALDTPYNTYLYPGLPPTPIANPGRESIEAALAPAPNPGRGDPICRDLPEGLPCVYLYYVLIDDAGNHAFAASLEQHEANIELARAAGVL
jgi:UPF0755 protein